METQKFKAKVILSLPANAKIKARGSKIEIEGLVSQPIDVKVMVGEKTKDAKICKLTDKLKLVLM